MTGPQTTDQQSAAPQAAPAGPEPTGVGVDEAGPAGVGPAAESIRAERPPAYHRLARHWYSYRWWKPLVGLVLSAVLYTVVSTSLFALFAPDAVMDPSLEPAYLEDMYDLRGFLFSFGGIALMLPCMLLGFRLAGCHPLGLFSSVAGCLRWSLMRRCLVPAVLLTAVGSAVALWSAVMSPEPLELGLQVPVIMVVLTVLVVPFQAAAEEYVFRGALMQLIGAWLKHPVWAIMLPVPLFVIGHIYDLPGQIGIVVFAVVAGWITWRTGGLEAAIVLHVVNNLMVALTGFLGVGDLNATETGWLVAGVSGGTAVIYAWWVDARERLPARTQAGTW